MRLRAVIRTYCRVGGPLGRACRCICVCVCVCAGRLLVNARVLQGPEDGRWPDGKKEERRKREVCSPEGFKAGAGLRGSYTAPPFAVPTPLGPPFEHPSPCHLPPPSSSSSSSIFSVHLLLPTEIIPSSFLFRKQLDKYGSRTSFLFHSSPPLSCSLFVYPLSPTILDLCASRPFSLSLSRVHATYRHKPMLGQYFSVAFAVISWPT